MITTRLLSKRILLLLIAASTFAPSAWGQSDVLVELRAGEVRCFENTVRMKHLAQVRTDDARLKKMIQALDLDTFEEGKLAEGVSQRIELSKTQIRFRLIVAGLEADQFQISGPDRVPIIRVQLTNQRDIIENRLQSQLAQQYLMSTDDLKITLDRRFGDLNESKLDYSGLELETSLETELPLGNQQISVQVQDQSGSYTSQKIPVTIALIRDLVVATQNISKGQTLSKENIESVRRPVASRSVRFASFEQVVGMQSQNDVQQYELIKSTAVPSGSARTAFAIKKNSTVSVIVRRGSLVVMLKDAKALDNGNPGDLIGLLNSTTRERIMARVIDSTTAEVSF